MGAMIPRCARCRRITLKPAYIDPSGWVLGETCAEKAGKAEPRQRRKARPVPSTDIVTQIGQLTLFCN